MNFKAEKFNNTKKMRTVIAAIMIVLIGVSFGYSAYRQEREAKIKMQQDIHFITKEVNSRIEEVETKNDELDALQEKNNELRRQVEHLKEEVSRGEARAFHVNVTAYDLSVQSCGKSPGHPEYGITASGISLAGQTLQSARAIAVDPQLIPLGSKVRIKFESSAMQQYNGVYTAVDTGGAIKGNRIDLFFGDSQSVHPSQAALDFGVQSAKVVIL